MKQLNPGKALTWTEIQARAHKFTQKWVGVASERSEAQTFWNEFLHIFGIDRRSVARFEEKAKRFSTGREGRIDLFWPKVIVAEHKSLGADLDKAESQLSDYEIDNSFLPQLYVVSDFARFRLWDLDSGERVEFTLQELPGKLRLFAPVAGYRRKPFHQEELASQKAAELLGQLYDYLEASGYAGHDLRVLIVRLLFCLFSDDTTVWRSGLFEEFIEYRTSIDGSDLGPQLTLLFQILNQAHAERQNNLDSDLASFPYINGGLFEESIATPFFDREGRAMLLEASAFDWKSVSPIIFGSLFQSVKTKDERRVLGEHYTSESNILKLLDPLVMEDLRKELAQAGSSRAALERLHNKLCSLRFLDPACGCGNFLAVAYRELRRIETEILVRLHAVDGHLQRILDIAEIARVSIDQFYGIEIEEFPSQIAQTAMYLVDHLENVAVAARFGQYFVRFPIKAEAHIHNANALEIDWKDVIDPSCVSYVVGNPPFKGHKYRTKEQSAELKRLWGSEYNKLLDYVTGWYRVAMDFGSGTDIRFAFVSTNSICQGEQVAHLWGPLLRAGYHMDFAHTPFVWTSEARGKAHVHVVIEGFVHGDTPTRKALYEEDIVSGGVRCKVVPQISPYLVPGPEMIVGKHRLPISELLPPVSYGSLPSDGGNLILKEYPEGDPIALSYTREFLGSKELVQGISRWCLWMPDGPAPGDEGRSPLLAARLEAVREWRQGRSNPGTKELADEPYRFFHVAEPKGSYMAIPAQVTDARRWYIVAHLDNSVVPSNTLYFAEDPEGLAFGILSSSMFIAWLRMIGGKIKSDPRFGKAAYNSFPIPDTLSERQRKAIVVGGQDVLAARRAIGTVPLADMYKQNVVPHALIQAHEKLDRAVDRAFLAQKPKWTIGERQAYLLDKYRECVGDSLFD